MGDRLRAGIPSRYVTSQLGQLSLASLLWQLCELLYPCYLLTYLHTPELSMGWVDPWVVLCWVGLGRDISVFGGLGWVHYSKSTKNLKGLF